MSKRPKLKSIITLFEAGEEFSLTETQYLQKTGAQLPRNNSYLKNKSAVATKAKKYGYKIIIKERIVIFEKVDKI